MRQSTPAFNSAGAKLIAVTPDQIADVARVVETDQLKYTVLSDTELTAVRAYGVFHENEPKGRRIPRPSTFVIGRDGRVKYAYIGESTSDRPPVEAVLEAVCKAV